MRISGRIRAPPPVQAAVVTALHPLQPQRSGTAEAAQQAGDSDRELSPPGVDPRSLAVGPAAAHP